MPATGRSPAFAPWFARLLSSTDGNNFPRGSQALATLGRFFCGQLKRSILVLCLVISHAPCAGKKISLTDTGIFVASR